MKEKSVDLALFFPMERYQDFLYLIGSLFAPVFSVVMIDYFVYKKDRTTEVINAAGVSAAIIGTGFYYMISKYDLIVGSTIPAMIITICIYIVLQWAIKLIKRGDHKNAESNQ